MKINGPESLKELVRLNLMVKLRKKKKDDTLCLMDLSIVERKQLENEVKQVLKDKRKLKKMSKNPFEENADKILRELGIMW